VSAGPGKYGRLALAACAIACAALAGCSSASAPDAQATGQTERATVIPAAKQLYAQLTAAGVAWAGGLVGGYETCGTDDPLATPAGNTSLQYTVSQQTGPFSKSVSYDTFKRQVVEALNAEGWQLHQVTGSAAQASYYAGHRDGFDLRLIEQQQPTFGSTATAYVSGSCFDAGSSAQQLIGKSPDYNFSEPTPTTTPTPKYS
jgi:hypothetical protein